MIKHKLQAQKLASFGYLKRDFCILSFSVKYLFHFANLAAQSK